MISLFWLLFYWNDIDQAFRWQNTLNCFLFPYSISLFCQWITDLLLRVDASFARSVFSWSNACFSCIICVCKSRTFPSSTWFEFAIFYNNFCHNQKYLCTITLGSTTGLLLTSLLMAIRSWTCLSIAERRAFRSLLTDISFKLFSFGLKSIPISHLSIDSSYLTS